MSSSSKRGSYVEEEIIVKPSIELIPDEYEHFQDSQNKITLHTFSTNDEIDKKNEVFFWKTIKAFGYNITSTNRHSLDTDNFVQIIDKIIEESKTNNAGLILYFSGCVREDGHLEIFDGITKNTVNIQEIWLRFDSIHCMQLKNKPKIFIFTLSSVPPEVETDGKKFYGTLQTAYDTPSEADILVVCNKTEEDNDFMEEFCKNIEEFGDTEHIVTLATCTISKTPTLIISTLTRNFYFTPSNIRGHHLVIEKNNKDIKIHVNKLKDALGNVEKKGKRSIFESFKYKIKPKDDKKSDYQNVEAASSTSSPRNSNAKPINDSSRRLSVSTRQRLTSQIEADTGKSSKKKEKKEKPFWKP